MWAQTLLERFVRCVAARRHRRAEALWRRREQRAAEAAARKAAHAIYEVAHAAERLDLARQLFDWAKLFARTPEARWAFGAHGRGRWPLRGWLRVGHGGVLWRERQRNWFSAHLPDTKIETPEALAASFTTAELLGALHHAQGATFWCDALQIEIAHGLGLMGRP